MCFESIRSVTHVFWEKFYLKKEIRVSLIFSWCGCRFEYKPSISLCPPPGSSVYAMLVSIHENIFICVKSFIAYVYFTNSVKNLHEVWITAVIFTCVAVRLSQFVKYPLCSCTVHAFRRNVRLSFHFILNWCHTNERTAMTYTYTYALISLSFWSADSNKYCGCKLFYFLYGLIH